MSDRSHRIDRIDRIESIASIPSVVALAMPTISIEGVLCVCGDTILFEILFVFFSVGF